MRTSWLEDTRSELYKDILFLQGIDNQHLLAWSPLYLAVFLSTGYLMSKRSLRSSKKLQVMATVDHSQSEGKSSRETGSEVGVGQQAIP